MFVSTISETGAGQSIDDRENITAPQRWPRTGRGAPHRCGPVARPGCSITPYTLPPVATLEQPGNPLAPRDDRATSNASAQCLQHFPGYVPAVVSPGRQRALCFDSFAVLHSGESKTPVCAVERLTRPSVEAAKGLKRTDRVYPEARLPGADRTQLSDYTGSGYDRGHMAPAGDMPNDTAKTQSFSLANMVPQAPELNQRAWNQI